MITLKLTEKEVLALTYALQLARKNHLHNWNNEIDSIFKQLKD